MSWDHLTATYVLKDARIVVAVKDGGAIVEHADIEYREGRAPSGYIADPSDPPKLEMLNHISILGAPQADTLASVPGRIVITGTHESGAVEIRGDGWIGYNEHGHLEGDFHPLPVIIADHVPGSPEDGQGMSIAEWTDHMRDRNPKTSPEFDRATRGRPYDDDEDYE
jgi:hypothetical protein